MGGGGGGRKKKDKKDKGKSAKRQRTGKGKPTESEDEEDQVTEALINSNPLSKMPLPLPRRPLGPLPGSRAGKGGRGGKSGVGGRRGRPPKGSSSSSSSSRTEKEKEKGDDMVETAVVLVATATPAMAAREREDMLECDTPLGLAAFAPTVGQATEMLFKKRDTPEVDLAYVDLSLDLMDVWRNRRHFSSRHPSHPRYPFPLNPIVAVNSGTRVCVRIRRCGAHY